MHRELLASGMNSALLLKAFESCYLLITIFLARGLCSVYIGSGFHRSVSQCLQIQSWIWSWILRYCRRQKPRKGSLLAGGSRAKSPIAVPCLPESLCRRLESRPRRGLRSCLKIAARPFFFQLGRQFLLGCNFSRSRLGLV
jgi:hypothetical protein